MIGRRMRYADRRFYLRWIAANAIAEGIGLGATFLIGLRIAQHWQGTEPSAAMIVAGALSAVALGALLEGALIGVAQGRVLREGVAAFPVGRWMRATAIGATLAWTLGMLPSTVIALLQTPLADAPASPPVEPPAWLQYSLAAVMGFVLGPILAFAQWRVLRVYAPRAGRWLLANALAWVAGMPLVFLGMDAVPWSGGAFAIASAVLAVCAFAGAVVGAIHGLWLLRLLPMRED